MHVAQYMNPLGVTSRIDPGQARGRVLIVDDDPEMCEILSASLARSDFETRCHTRAEEALEAIRQEEFDVMLVDVMLGGMDGLQLCERVAGNRPDLPVVVVTALGSVDTAVGALRAGAVDFITKPVDVKLLGNAVSRAMRRRQATMTRIGGPASETEGLQDIIGESPAMRQLKEMLVRVAESDASVLLTGESGTGKELVARALHRCGPRRSRRFVAINCAAMPESLLESQLFGHVRGAFTDAKSSHVGLLNRADGGTLFLDEIGEMPLALQPKLLRALQERAARPLGGDNEVPFDVRLVVATNRNLDDEVAAGRFRMDLYFRVNVIHIDIPPLRERGADVLLLAEHAIKRFARRSHKPVLGLSTPAAERLLAYRWPGNVREVQNCMERAVALTRFEKIVVDDLPAHIAHLTKVAPQEPRESEDIRLLPVDEVERRHILSVLEAVSGNKTLAARVLGLDRKTLYRKLKQYGGFAVTGGGADDGGAAD